VTDSDVELKLCDRPDCFVCSLPRAQWHYYASLVDKPKAPVLDDGDPDTIDQNEVKK
jgi:hypothetical protein